MATSDYIAFGILIFCTCVSLFGLLKWLLRLVAGAGFGVAILVCISFLANDPQFDNLSRGVFRQGLVFPCMRQHIRFLDHVQADASPQPEKGGDQSDS